jgi:hypothetical protein
LFYRSGTSVISAAVTREPAFRVLSRHLLMAGGAYSFNGNHAQYDVLPGDSTFVFVRTGGDAVQMVLVANWLDELRRRKPR